MTINFSKIALSASVIAFVTALMFVGTQAFFSDTETSTGNTFTAGALDLRVDSTAHFNGLICEDTNQDGFGDEWHADGVTFATDDDVPAEHYPQPGDPCTGTWVESDLIADAVEFQFFNLTDIKPGDEGENTISLHVYNNDAWGCFLVDNVQDDDNTCTEPETESTDPECSVVDPDTDLGANGLGELGSSLTFDGWLDQGAIPGFQCNHDGANPTVGPCDEDPTEGDNIFQEGDEGPLFWDDETVDEASEGPFEISDVLTAAYFAYNCDANGDATGNTDYAECHGLAEDGRMVGSATYYFGLAWNIPDTVGNEAQTDSLVTDMVFEVIQHRNNPDYQCTEPEPEPDPATLTLIKEVVNDNSGTAVAGDFELSASGPTPFSGFGSASSDVNPGTYDLSEVENIGYSASAWVCVGTGTQDDDNTVTLAAGETLTCTITNDDIPL